ncbi:MAG: virulence factor [Sphingobacterium sp.]|uniref:AcvB/VirJ family lysyl-phosphatidylglycerol hydrolase n=1 Tax=unclassified Sphingobacterium TaxID=2609468 RepID=UPI00283D3859|nr:AcvB/VirJ family lysyl-phosphatidylglycerol hydrolase [Sphingobacterium sp.]MDR3010228.1 virulence factor [Sphingobacterium sp.]
MKTAQYKADRLFLFLFFWLCLALKPMYAEVLPNYVIPLKDTNNKQKTMLVFITGDGGYNDFSKSLLSYFSLDGYPRLVIDAKKYFWKKKTPQEAGREFERYIDHFKKEWDCDQIYLIGHSFSAGVLPFVLNNFSDPLKKSIRHVTYLSPDQYASFEVTVSTMLNWKQKPNGYEVLAEVMKLKQFSSTYVFCKEGEEDLVKMFRNAGLKVEVLAGPHNYNRDFKTIYNTIRLR